MSNFTTEVRFICESEAGALESKGFNCIDEILRKSVEKVFNFDFPIFDEKYRIPLETKILRYYYTREICDETVGLWKLRLYNRLNLIMPYYNQLYESALIKFNPLYDVDLTTTHTRTNDHTQNDTKSGETHNTHEDRTITDFEKTGNETSEFEKSGVEDVEFRTNNNKNSNSNTDGSENKTYENHVTEDDEDHSTVTTDETTVYHPATTQTTHDYGWSHNDLHILEDHDTTNDKIDETYKDYTSNKPNITVNDTGNKWDYYSDTPQGSVQNLENHSYLTNARNNTNTNTQTTTGETQIYNEGEKHSTHGSNYNANDSHVTAYSDDRNNTVTMSGSDTTDHDNVVTTNATSDKTIDTTGEEHSDNHSNTVYGEAGSETGTNHKTNSESGDSTNDITENSNTTVNNIGNFDITNTETGNIVFNGTEEYIQHVVGKTAGASYSKMLLDFRDTFINVDKMIIDNLSDLFFGLYE